MSNQQQDAQAKQAQQQQQAAEMAKAFEELKRGDDQAQTERR